MIDHIYIKGLQEEYQKSDGRRILVEKKWPARVDQNDFFIDEWVNDLAPSKALLKTATLDMSGVCEFVNAYWLELEMNIHLDPFILRVQEYNVITLVHNHENISKLFAKVLKDYLNQILSLYKEH